jgi:hypothetical protein
MKTATNADQGQDAGAVAQELRKLRDVLDAVLEGPWSKLAHIREHQRIHMRTYQKYPDFMEVGVDVWEALHDWHVHVRQPMHMTRNAEGRYEMGFIDTRIILRPDFEPTRVAIGYDGNPTLQQ